MPELKLKSIPSPSNLPPEVQAFAFPVKEAIDLLLGRVGDGKDAAVTRRNAGQVLGGTTIINTGTATGGGYVPDLTAPPAPTGLAATPGFSVINLEFDDAPYTVGHGHAYTAVYRSSDSLRGNAEMIGFTPGTIYVDSVGSSAGPFYYWIRFVTRDGVMGPWNAVSGVSASTATDPTYLLGLLAGNITETSLKTEVIGGKDAFVFNTKTFAIKYSGTGYVPFIVQAAPTTINGHVIPPGVYLDEAFMRRFVAQSGQIGSLAVDDAAIANVSAAKLTIGDGTVGGSLKSTYFASGVSGWKINPDGTAEFNNVLVHGTVYADSGYFKGTLIGGAAATFASGTGLWAGYDSSTYKARIGTATGSRMEWNGSALTIYGAGGQVLLSSGSGIPWDQVSGGGKPLDNSGRVIDGGTGTGPGQRQSNDPPSYYPVGKTQQFKWSTSVGIPDGGAWISLETNKQYGDNSGGMMTQWAYGQSGATWKRCAFPTDAAWGGWTQDLDRNTYTGDLNATWGANGSNLNVGIGTNLLANTEFIGTMAPAVMGWNPGGCAALYLVTSGSWIPVGCRGIQSYLAGRNGNAYNVGCDVYLTGGYGQAAYGIPVVAGRRYEFSAELASHRCDSALCIDFFDKDNVQCGGSGAPWVARSSGGNALSANANGTGFVHAVVFGTAPSNAVYASIYWRRSDTDAGQSDSYAWLTHPLFGEAGSAQAVPSAYSPGIVTNTSQIYDGAGLGLTAEWYGVSGPGKPADNATVGAVIGTNLGGTFNTSNIGVYMPGAAIGNAQIDRGTANKLVVVEADILNANVSTLKIKGNAVNVPAYVESIGGPLSVDSYVQWLGTSGLPFDDAGRAMLTLSMIAYASHNASGYNVTCHAKFEVYCVRDSDGASFTYSKEKFLGDFVSSQSGSSTTTTSFDLPFKGTYYFRAYLRLLFGGGTQTLAIQSISMSINGIMR